VHMRSAKLQPLIPLYTCVYIVSASRRQLDEGIAVTSLEPLAFNLNQELLPDDHCSNLEACNISETRGVSGGTSAGRMCAFYVLPPPPRGEVDIVPGQSAYLICPA
jgi:hypothetical protein